MRNKHLNFAVLLVGLIVTSLACAAESGRTLGILGVSKTGAAQYSVPLWVPPGVRGVQPHLELAYGGTLSVGTMGVGWVLSGLPSIYPCQNIWPIESICLDGKPLGHRTIDSEYPYTFLRDGLVYTDVEKFRYVVAHMPPLPPGTESLDYDTMWFSAVGEDGLLYEFGRTADSYHWHWMVNKVSDRDGNSYIINYDKAVPASNAPLPVSIAYVPVTSNSTNYKYVVNFEYTDAGYSPFSMVNGYALHGSKLLNSITVRSGTKILRKYSLSYETSPISRLEPWAGESLDTAFNVRRLTHIQECADDQPTNCLAPTDITYHNAASSQVIEYNDAPGDLIQSISDGYGVVFNINYENALVNLDPIFNTFSRPSPFVSQVSATDGSGGTYTKTYSYTNAKKADGYFVAEGVDVIDSRTGITQKQTYSWPSGKLLQEESLRAGQLVSSTTYTQTYKNIVIWRDQYGYPFEYALNWASPIVEKTYEVGGAKNGQLISTRVTEYNSPDDDLNFGTIKVTHTDNDVDSPYSGQSWTTTTNNVFSADTSSNWCVGLLLDATVTQEAPGVPAITRRTSYTPDYAKCRHTQTIIEPTKTSDYRLVQSYEFDVFGNINKITSTGATSGSNTPITRVTQSNWGNTGQFPVWVINELNQSTSFDYDYDYGVQTRITDANGISKYTSYDAFQRKLSESYPDGTSKTWTYSDCRTASSCFNANQRLQVYERALGVGGTTISDQYNFLDQFDRPLVTRSRLMDGSYSQTETRYNVRGLIELQSAPCIAASCSYWSTNYYDDLGRLTKSTRPVSATNSALQETNISYQGATTVITDAEGKQNIKVATVAGTMVRSKDHNGYYQDLKYDAFGSLLNVTDSQGAVLFSATYDYGIKPLQRTVVDTDLGTRSYGYNAFGEQISSSDGKGNSFSAEYDALSRLVKRIEPDAVSEWIWGSNPAAHNVGALASIKSTTNEVYQENYFYDGIGRLAQQALAVPGLGASAIYDYTYNGSNGLLDTLTYPTSTAGYRLKLQHGYQNGVLTQVTDYNAGTIYWRANATNALGKITQESMGNGLVSNHAYDAVTGLLNYIQCGIGSGACSQNESYLYDKVGNVTQRQNNNLGLTENFYYDGVHRLDYSQLNGVTNLDMSYDVSGNITARSDVANNAAWTYDGGHKHRVLQAGGNSYGYDVNGNVTTRNGNSIAWTSYNYPSQISGPGEAINLYYDANRQRYKQVYTKGGTTETTLYVGGLMQKVTVNGVDDYRYAISANGQRIAIMSRTSSGTNNTRYVLTNHQGSVAKLTDSSGNTIVSESFAAFGARRNPITWSGQPTNGELTTSNAITREGYTGQTALGELGLIHMNGRVEDAVTGRFLSADPYITEPDNTQNYNRYSYVYNNPITLTDPSGFCVTGTHICSATDDVLMHYQANGPTASNNWEGSIIAAHNLAARTNSTFVYMETLTVGDMTYTSLTLRPNSTWGFSPDSLFSNSLSDGFVTTTVASEGKSVPIQTPQSQKPDTCYSISKAINIFSSAVGGAVAGTTGAALTGNIEAIPAAAFGGAIVGTVSGMFENRYATAAAATGVGIGSYVTGRASGASAIAATASRVATGYAPEGMSALAGALGGAVRGASSPGAFGAGVSSGLAAVGGVSVFGKAALAGFLASQLTNGALRSVNNYINPECSQ